MCTIRRLAPSPYFTNIYPTYSPEMSMKSSSGLFHSPPTMMWTGPCVSPLRHLFISARVEEEKHASYCAQETIDVRACKLCFADGGQTQNKRSEGRHNRGYSYLHTLPRKRERACKDRQVVAAIEARHSRHERCSLPLRDSGLQESRSCCDVNAARRKREGNQTALKSFKDESLATNGRKNDAQL